MNNPFHSRLFTQYGSLLVLLLLCAYYSVATLSEQHPVDADAAREVAGRIVAEQGAGARVLIVVRDTSGDREYAAALNEELHSAGARVVATVTGQPSDARVALEKFGEGENPLDAVATHHPASQWGPLQVTSPRVYKPDSYIWPSFLTRENLLNVVNQNADIAIIAIGMTMVIIAAGIDLSVGSLLALSGVMTAVAVQRFAGGAEASAAGVIACCLFGAGLCALCGATSGVMVTVFGVPAFVVTLGMMMVARGLALIIAVGYQSALAGGATEGTPEAVKVHAESFGWLGNGALLGIPNPILLMIVLYCVAHVAMTRTSFGRYLYAVGGNPEAARLSGVPVVGVLIVVYALCGAMAGLAGVVDASRFEGGRPNAGELYELQAIAAVVVGGASLAGGQGRVFGTLVGAMIIAVIQNGLNMAGVKSYEQKVVFGALILAAVLLDRLKKR